VTSQRPYAESIGAVHSGNTIRARESRPVDCGIEIQLESHKRPDGFASIRNAARGRGGSDMTSILILLALSALSGFVIGKSRFAWPALVVTGAVLTPLAAVVLQWQGFAPLPGIFTIVACLVVNQVAYVLAIRLNDDLTGRSDGASPEHHANGVPRDDRDDDIRHKDERNQNTPSRLVGLADR
jgi:hypothetical protein